MFLNSFLLLILILSFILCIYIEVKYLSPTIIFWIALTGVFLLPHLIYSLLLIKVDLKTVIKASLFVSAFNFLYFFSKVLIISSIRKNRYNWVFNDVTISKNDRINRFLIFCYLSGLAIWILGLLFAGFNPFSAKWADTLKVNSVFSQVGNLLIFTASGLLLYNYIARKTWILLIVIFLNLGCIILLRARILLIALLIPFVIMILYRNNKFNFKLKFLWLILVFTFSIFFLQAFRWAGGIKDLSIKKIPALVSTSLTNMTGSHGEFHLVTEFYFIIEGNNTNPVFGQGRTYWRLLLFWLPTPIIPEPLKFIKPRDFAIDIYNFVYHTPLNKSGTTHPTFYGDLFANFGWIGILMAVFWAFISEFLDSIFSKNQAKLIFLLGCISTFYVIIARGAIYNGSINLIIPFFLVSLMFYKYKIGKTVIF
jgi:hypothetical protein